MSVNILLLASWLLSHGSAKSHLFVSNKKKERVDPLLLSVRLIGLEPTRITTPDPKSGASTNFATSAITKTAQR